MAKISSYAWHTSPIPTDYLPIVDVTAGQTKRISYSEFTTRPHINVSDSNTKTVSNTAAEYAVTYDTVSDQVGITFTPGDSKIYVPRTGLYLAAISAVVDTTTPIAALFDLWIKVNGVNLANSNTQIGINNANLQQVLAVTFAIQLNADDYFELFYHANNTNAQMLAIAAQTGPPAIPACPSIIVAVSKIGS